MRLTSGSLLDCAHERLAQGLVILEADPYVGAPLAAYVSGVAVECAILAKHMIVSDEVNARHRLRELADEADYASRLNEATRDAFDADLSQIIRGWDNLLRYCSAGAYVEFLVRRGVEVPTPNGMVRAALARRSVSDEEVAQLAAEATYERARRVVNYGEYFWERRR